MKKNLPLIIGIALPLIFITVILLMTVVPSFFANPQYGFIFTDSDTSYYDYAYKYSYKIENGKLERVEVVIPDKQKEYYSVRKDAPNLFLYETQKQAVRSISFEEAQKLSIDQSLTSPDGYIVDYKFNNNGIFEIFGSNNENNIYFIKGSLKKQIRVPFKYYGFVFLGWVK